MHRPRGGYQMQSTCFCLIVLISHADGLDIEPEPVIHRISMVISSGCIVCDSSDGTLFWSVHGWALDTQGCKYVDECPMVEQMALVCHISSSITIVQHAFSNHTELILLPFYTMQFSHSCTDLSQQLSRIPHTLSRTSSSVTNKSIALELCYTYRKKRRVNETSWTRTSLEFALSQFKTKRWWCGTIIFPVRVMSPSKKMTYPYLQSVEVLHPSFSSASDASFLHSWCVTKFPRRPPFVMQGENFVS